MTWDIAGKVAVFLTLTGFGVALIRALYRVVNSFIEFGKRLESKIDTVIVVHTDFTKVLESIIERVGLCR